VVRTVSVVPFAPILGVRESLSQDLGHYISECVLVQFSGVPSIPTSDSLWSWHLLNFRGLAVLFVFMCMCMSNRPLAVVWRAPHLFAAVVRFYHFLEILEPII